MISSYSVYQPIRPHFQKTPIRKLVGLPQLQLDPMQFRIHHFWFNAHPKKHFELVNCMLIYPIYTISQLCIIVAP